MRIRRSHDKSSPSALHRTRLTRSPMLIALAIEPSCTAQPPPPVSCRCEIADRGAVAVALAGVGLGLAFGSRVLAGVAAPIGLSALLFVLIAEGHAGGWKPAAQRCGQFFWIMLPALGLGYLIMGLLWPWSVLSPLNPLHAAEYFDTFFEKPWQELYEGQLIDVPDMPASYLPHLFMLKLPEIMLALGLIGTVGALDRKSTRLKLQSLMH